MPSPIVWIIGIAFLAGLLAVARRMLGRPQGDRAAVLKQPQRLAPLPRPASPSPARFAIGYDQVLVCDSAGVAIDAADLTFSRRAAARKLFGDRIFIPWDRIERIDVKPHRGLGTDTIEAAEYLFHLHDGQQRMPDVRTFDDLRAASTDGPINRWLISRLTTMVPENELSSLTRVPVSIERDEDTPGQQSFIDYCRSVGQVPVTIYGSLHS